MSKAEQRYLEYFQDGRLRNCSSKEAFLLAYHQAEKDLELSWKDIEKIIKIHTDIYLDFFINDNDCKVDTKEYYQEVLNRFNKKKGK